jgi:hypothetical protein
VLDVLRLEWIVPTLAAGVGLAAAVAEPCDDDVLDRAALDRIGDARCARKRYRRSAPPRGRAGLRTRIAGGFPPRPEEDLAERGESAAGLAPRPQTRDRNRTASRRSGRSPRAGRRSCASRRATRECSPRPRFRAGSVLPALPVDVRNVRTP